MTETTDIAVLMRDMRDLADRIVECQGENSNGEEIIHLYDQSDTTFKAQNILLVLNAFEAERQRAGTRIADLDKRLRYTEETLIAANDLLTAAEKERDALKSAHSNMVTRCALLRQRTDLPVERIPAYNSLVKDQDENAALKAKLANPVELPARFKPEVSKVDLFKGSPVMKLDATGGWLNRTAVIVALNSAGFTVKGE